MDEGFRLAVSVTKHRGSSTTCPPVNFEAAERHWERFVALSRRRFSTSSLDTDDGYQNQRL
jgi:hypothetical protein